MKLLEAHALSHSFDYDLFSDVSLDLFAGESIAIIGVSGSGKSTLLAIISAMDKPSSGEVLIDADPISKLPDLHASHFRAKRMGFIFQHFNLLEALSVKENLLAVLIPTGLPAAQMEHQIFQSMTHAQISHKADQIVRDLSGGEKQRCAIARALVNDPDMLFCDEPTANLDHANSLYFIELLKKLRAQGKTIIIATHDPLFESSHIQDRLFHMHEGQVHE